ncbi:MAG: hypothetical protein Q4B99_01795 [Clostridia bacterium]|nr:hypothetical protein [Clostridia bacterium]
MFLGSCNILNRRKRGLAHFVLSEVRWYRKNNYRIARRNESACFNTLLIMARDKRWVTVIEDSNEALSYGGFSEQAHIRSIDGSNAPALLFNYVNTNHDQGCMLMARNAPDGAEGFICVRDPEMAYKEALAYPDEALRTPRAADFAGIFDCTDEELADIWSMELADERHRIQRLAELAGIEPGLAGAGFNSFVSANRGQWQDLDGYSAFMASFCVDDRKVKQPYLMAEGVPALEIVECTSVREGELLTVTLTVVNRGGGHPAGTILMAGAGHSDDRSHPLHCELISAVVSASYDGEWQKLPERREYRATPEYTMLDSSSMGYVAAFEDNVTPAGAVIPYREKRRLRRQSKLHELELDAALVYTLTLRGAAGSESGMILCACPIGNVHTGAARCEL